MQKALRFVFAWILATCVTTATKAQDWIDPKPCSPSGVYCVKIVNHALPKAPEFEGDTLVLSKKGKTLAKFPTFGYLLNIYWSPGEHFVALNNRRANSGDWLWVISLADGKALKIPQDLAESLGNKDLGRPNGGWRSDDDPKDFDARFPQCQGEGILHVYFFAKDWLSSTELRVFHEFTCSHFDPWIEVENVYRVERSLTLIRQSVSTRSETLRD